MSNADQLLRGALDAGLDLRLDGDALKLSGDTAAVTAWAPRLRPFKGELIAQLNESSAVTHALLAAAMRACDYHGDGDTARADMRRDVLATPHDQRVDLLDYFRHAYRIDPAIQDLRK